MQAEALRTLYGYNRWSTERVLEAAAQLTPEQFHAPGGAGHGSVRDTLLHLIVTQQSWLSWWDGSLPPDQAYGFTMDPAAVPDAAALRAAWEAADRQTQAFVERLTDADAARLYTHTLPGGVHFQMPLWQMMLHIVNHGTQHRSEVAALLTGFGQSPGNLDLLFYLWRPGG